MKTLAIPTLPMIDVRTTRNFYEALGFVCAHEQEPPDVFLMMILDTAQLHFFEYRSINPHANFSGCLIYVPDLQSLHQRFRGVHGINVLPIELKPWGMHEFAFRDPNGNLIRFGELKFDI